MFRNALILVKLKWGGYIYACSYDSEWRTWAIEQNYPQALDRYKYLRTAC